MHSNAFRSCGFVLKMIYANEIGCCLCVVCVLSVRCQCLSPLRLTFMHLPLFCLVNCTILLRVCLQAVPASVGKWSRVCTHPSPFCLKLMLADPHFLLCARCRKAHYPGVMVASHGTGRAGKPKGLSEALPPKKDAAPKHYMLSALSKQWDFHGARAPPASHS